MDLVVSPDIDHSNITDWEEHNVERYVLGR
jgi:hypothetical protein